VILALAAAVAGTVPVEIPERLRFEAPAGWQAAEGDLGRYAGPGEDPPLALLRSPGCRGAGVTVYQRLMPVDDPDGVLPYLRDLCLGEDATLRDARTEGALARITCDRPTRGRMTRQVYATVGQPRAKVVVYAIPLECWDQLEPSIERSIASIRDIDPRPPPDQPAPYQSRTYPRRSPWSWLGAIAVMGLALIGLAHAVRRLRR
jgi:hypothetical protein